MLKKSLIVLIALTMLTWAVLPAVADQEQEKEDVKKAVDKKLKLKADDWPVTFDWVDLGIEGNEFIVPVYMQVKLYLEILNMHGVIDEGIILDKQVSMEKYEGCSIPIEIKSNFDLELGVKETILDAGNLLECEKDKLEVREECDKKGAGGSVPATLCDTTATRVIYFKVKNCKLVHHPFGKKIHIADIQVRVRPDFDAEWVDP